MGLFQRLHWDQRREAARRFATSGSVVALALYISSGGAAAQTVDDPNYNPNRECVEGAFTDFGNTQGPGFSSPSPFGAVTLSAGQASTTQILQNVAEKRQESYKQCPAGFVNEGGSCVPSSTVAGSQQVAAASSNTGQSQSSGSAASSTSGGTSSAPSKAAAKAAKAPVGGEDTETPSGMPGYEAQLAQPTNAAWGGGFYEYENRSDIPNGSGGSFDRKQRSYGGLSGVEHTFPREGRSSFRIGGLAGYSAIDQDFGSQTTTDNNNIGTFPIRFGFNQMSSEVIQGVPGGIPIDPNFSGLQLTGQLDPTTMLPEAQRILKISNPLTIVTQTEQRLNGPTFGLYGTYTLSGGTFIDFLGKVDLYDLRQRQVQQITGASRLNPDIVVSNRNGCISRMTPDGLDPADKDRRDTGATSEDVLNNLLVDPVTTTRERIVRSSVDNITLASNIGHHFDRPGGWWFEPLVGFRYNYASFGSNAALLGLKDGHSVRIEGGATVGDSRLLNYGYGPALWTVSLGGFLYSDVLIDGYVRNGNGFSPLSVEADEGKVRVRGVLRNELDLLDGTIAFAEVAARGGEDLWAIGGTIGIRFEW